MIEQIYLSSPDVTDAEEDALVRAFRSGWIAPLGSGRRRLRGGAGGHTAVASYCVALSSGTAALHLGLLTPGGGSWRCRGDVVDDLRRDGQRDRLHGR